MNKKILRATIILISILALTFVVQPNIAKTSAENLLVFNKIGPAGEIYREDILIIGGTIYNNQSLHTYILLEFWMEVYHEDNRSLDIEVMQAPYSFASLSLRNTVEPWEYRSFSFDYLMDDRWPVDTNYTVSLFLTYIEIQNQGEEVTNPYQVQIGETKYVDVTTRREDAPSYIYAVFVLLILGILAFVVLGIVGWVRERRARQ